MSVLRPLWVAAQAGTEVFLVGIVEIAEEASPLAVVVEHVLEFFVRIVGEVVGQRVAFLVAVVVTVAQLQEDESVGEILVIDNSCKGFECTFDKVKVLVQKENLFVNPAWNYGIKVSSPEYPYFGVLNDDIIFPKNLFKDVKAFLDKGLEEVDQNENKSKLEVLKTVNKPKGKEKKCC